MTVNLQRVYAPGVDVDTSKTDVFTLFAGGKVSNWEHVEPRSVTDTNWQFVYEPNSLNTLVDNELKVQFDVLLGIEFAGATAFRTHQLSEIFGFRQYPLASSTTCRYNINGYQNSSETHSIVHELDKCYSNRFKISADMAQKRDIAPNYIMNQFIDYSGAVVVSVLGSATDVEFTGNPLTIANGYPSLSPFSSYIIQGNERSNRSIIDMVVGYASDANPLNLEKTVGSSEHGCAVRARETPSNTTHYFRIRCIENILPHDPLFNTHGKSLYGVKSIELNYTFIDSIQRMFCGTLDTEDIGSNTTHDFVAIGAKVVDKSVQLLVRSYTPSLLYQPPPTNMYPLQIIKRDFKQYLIESNNLLMSSAITDLSFNENTFSNFSSATLNLDTIPTKLIVYIRYAQSLYNRRFAVNGTTLLDTGRITAPGCEFADINAIIDTVNITFNGQPSILNSMTHYQLYELSKRNGLDMTYSEYCHCGGPLIINPAYDLNLPDDKASSVLSKCSLQVVVGGHMPQASMPLTYASTGANDRTNIPVELHTVVLYDGILHLTPEGNYIPQLSFDLPDITKAPIHYGGHHFLRKVGGGFMDFLRSFGNTVSSVVSPIAKVLSVPLGMINPALGAVASGVGATADAIKSATGGRYLSKKDLNKLLK